MTKLIMRDNATKNVMNIFMKRPNKQVYAWQEITLTLIVTFILKCGKESPLLGKTCT